MANNGKTRAGEDNDSELVRRAQNGDKKAFDLLVLKYQHKVGNLIARYIRDPAEVLDVTQEAFIKAYRALPKFRGDSAFYTWLYRIAIRNAGKLRPANLAELGDPADHGADPLAHCIADSERDNLWRSAKRVLSDEVFAAMWLRYVEDMSVRDIASVLERSASWTKVNLLRGRRALELEMNGKAGNAGSEAYG